VRPWCRTPKRCRCDNELAVLYRRCSHKASPALYINSILMLYETYIAKNDHDLPGPHFGLLIDRNDGCINVCVMQFTDDA
jgi:hypothetical protein